MTAVAEHVIETDHNIVCEDFETLDSQEELQEQRIETME